MDHTLERALIRGDDDLAKENASEVDEVLSYNRNLTPSVYSKSLLPHSNTHAHDFLALLTKQPIIIFIVDRDGVFTFLGGQNLKYLGITAEQVLGRTYHEMYQDFPITMTYVQRALAGEEGMCVERYDNFIFEAHLIPLFNEAGLVHEVIGLALDIRERVLAEEALQARERLFSTLIEQTSDLIFIVDAVGMYRFASPSHLSVLGYTAEDLLHGSIFGLVHPVDLPHAFSIMANALQKSGTTFQLELRVKRADDSWITLECTGRNCLAIPDIEGIVITAHDITQRKAMEDQLRHLALHDILTDLPNRVCLQNSITQAIEDAKRSKSQFALLVLGLDRFEEVKDAFGHSFGDLLLQQIGLRLQQAIHNLQTIARSGEDEFALLLPNATSAGAWQVIEKVHAVLKEPFYVKKYPLYLEVSIGVILYPEHGSNTLSLLQEAHAAMYKAKQAHEPVAFYEPSYHQDTLQRLQLIGGFLPALENNELQLYYQPKVGVNTMQPYGVEALVRWISPELGFIPPDQFIPLTEQTGLIHSLTRWVLETAIRQCRNWLDNGLELSIAVNISARNLREDTLPETIAMLLEQYDVPPRLLHVEVTESAVMVDMSKALDVLNRIAKLGIALSIDDFGTGQSSLAYLKGLPIDELKIDRSFVRHIATNEVDAIIVRSIISLAHTLGLKVIAEGAEDQRAVDLLASYQCDAIQGYFFSRPLSAPEFEKWVSRWRSTPLVMS